MNRSLGFFSVVAVVLFVGVTDASPQRETVGAVKAAVGEFPYVVSLRWGSNHFCDGVIVGPRHIVTSANCVNGIESDMYYGFYVATGSVSTTGGTTHVFSKVVSHPDYDFHSNDPAHDIAMIVLAEDIAFDENQAKLDLPTELVPNDAVASLVGWGFPDGRTQDISTDLMKINVKTLRADSCTNHFVGVSNIKESYVCTLGRREADTCSGTGGGSLVYNGQLVGITSVGMPCVGEHSKVFTSVYHHVDWIRKTMKE